MANQEKAVATVSPFFARCCAPIERPEWLEALTGHLSALTKCAESGEVVIIACDPSASGRLHGYIVASAGRLVYRCEADATMDEEKQFWSFASANYLWITPTLGLRKEVVARVGGKADGQSLKLGSDSISADEFIEALLQSVSPKLKQRQEAERSVALVESSAPPLAPVKDVAGCKQGESGALLPDAVAMPCARVSDLAVGQTMSMF